MEALYAFSRITDDLADGPGEFEAKRIQLHDWRERLKEFWAGKYSHRLHPALHRTLTDYEIPVRWLDAIIEGCETDLGPVRIQSRAEFQRYCNRVAGTVGMACTRIWGLKPGVTFKETDPLSIVAGRAFQLTNILRDLGEDLKQNRVYLPADELERLNCTPDRWPSDQFPEMVLHFIALARADYGRSSALAEMLSPEGRAIFQLMTRAYRMLLDRIEAAGVGVLSQRVRLTPFQKVRLATRAWVPTWLM